MADTDLKNENDVMRAILAYAPLPCQYCSLPKERMGECARGFPGCARADDMTALPAASEEPVKRYMKLIDKDFHLYHKVQTFVEEPGPCNKETGCPNNTHNLHCGYPNCNKGKYDAFKRKQVRVK